MASSAVRISCIVIFSLSALDALQHDLPSYIKRCHLYDPKINECLLTATEQVKPFLIRGIPELGLSPIEPFLIPEITLRQGSSALNFEAHLKNIVVRGLSNYNFSQFDFDVPNLQWFLKMSVGPLEIEGNYTIKGRILLAPVVGGGNFVAKIKNSNVTGYQKAEKITRDGEEYVSPTVTNTTIHVDSPKVKVEGLFGDNKELNSITNRVINENAEVLFEDLRPVVEKVIVTLFEDYLFKGLEDNVPFRKLYLPDKN